MGWIFTKSFVEKTQKLQTKIKNNGIEIVPTTVAPTGSGAIVARVTSGVEPILRHLIKEKKKNDSLGKEFDTFTVYHPVVKEMFGKMKTYQNMSLQHIMLIHTSELRCKVWYKNTSTALFHLL